MAERVGFEPTEAFTSLAFEASALDRAMRPLRADSIYYRALRSVRETLFFAIGPEAEAIIAVAVSALQAHGQSVGSIEPLEQPVAAPK